MNDEFRAFALAVPLATEQDHFGRPSFRVNGKIFAQLSQDGGKAVLKIPAAQQWLISSFPGACASPGRWGESGWTELPWRSIPVEVLQDLLRQACEAVEQGRPSKRRRR